ncbi:MAG TPA: type II toxin-antitoxin system RelE/ParE family toxin, partial [Blastocatellia bacterium]|nr:type II toxin-antitoxin system RelE/ParE family toxin [Blastocatellia bacterium]
DARGIPAQFAKRIRLQLDTLNAASVVSQMNVPGWNLHELKGDRKGTYALKVSGNQRLTFKFVGTNALDVDLEDYH